VDGVRSILDTMGFMRALDRSIATGVEMQRYGLILEATKAVVALISAPVLYERGLKRGGGWAKNGVPVTRRCQPRREAKVVEKERRGKEGGRGES
jgi:hypothetical protein